MASVKDLNQEQEKLKADLKSKRRVGEKICRPGKQVYGTEESGKVGVSFIQLEGIWA